MQFRVGNNYLVTKSRGDINIYAGFSALSARFNAGLPDQYCRIAESSSRVEGCEKSRESFGTFVGI
jgi:hypothetical protein